MSTNDEQKRVVADTIADVNESGLRPGWTLPVRGKEAVAR